jgi:hypothetical protein
MSLQRTINTGLLLGANLQAAGLRRQVTQMQQLAAAQQNQQDQIASMRQIVFESHKLLDGAEHNLERNPAQAVYAVRIASFSLAQVHEASFTDLADKKALYENQQRAANLLARSESVLPAEIAQDLHRLAWLQQVHVNLLSLLIWLEIAETMRASAILFTPPAGFFRGLLILIMGNIIGGMIAGVLFHAAHLIGFLVYLGCNGITLLIADIVARQKLLKKCDTRAREIGGWVGSKMRPSTARQFVEQSRAQLSSWEYKSTATTSAVAAQELSTVDAEIAELQQAHFPQ